ncbi:unnamed protein product [Clonostachys solani]|uniref:Rhodopsin domain-containing protein n=1 Tax=Clonostachys solani TaxID=160281 RepID=A0A9N9ZHA4_9HYPO|nr:unnamed protein product [Clonostachys solani]
MLDPNNDSLWAMPVPAGEVRTPVNPPTSAQGAVATGIATTVIAGLAVAVRIFTRGYVVRNLGIDDSLQAGSGNHIWDIPAPDFRNLLIYQFVLTITYSTSVSFSKLSILTLYLRLSPEKYFRICVYAFIGIVTAYTVAYQFYIIFQCSPVNKFWMPEVEGSCIGKMGPMMTLSIANIVIDIIILFIPVKVVLPLKIPLRQKISLIIIFAAGGFVCAAAIQRTILMPRLLTAVDYSWEVSGQVIWGFIEVNAGIICASVPALKPFFMRYLPFILTSRLMSSSSQPESHSTKLTPFSNTNTSKKQRSKRIMESYELPSRDDLPNQRGEDDDQAKLWAVKTTVKKKDGNTSDDNSFESFEEQYLGRLGRRGMVTRGNSSAHQGEGISVITETKVSYGG